jgi:hypothetical protein
VFNDVISKILPIQINDKSRKTQLPEIAVLIFSALPHVSAISCPSSGSRFTDA